MRKFFFRLILNIFIVFFISLNFIVLPVDYQIFSAYRTTRPSIQFQLHEGIGGLKGKALISEWNRVFDRMKLDAEVYPFRYKKTEVLFLKGDNVYVSLPLYVPVNISREEKEIVARYIATTINNYIITSSAQGVVVKGGAEDFCDLIKDSFNESFNRSDALVKVPDMVSDYEEIDSFKIVSYKDNQSLLKDRVEYKIEESRQVRTYKPHEFVTVNIGKTKIKFSILNIDEEGSYELKSLYSIDTPKEFVEGYYRTDIESIKKAVVKGINDLLEKNGLVVSDIDGIGISAALILKRGEPAKIRTGWAWDFDDYELEKMAELNNLLSEKFGNILVVMGNDGDMEALGLSKFNTLTGVLALKFGTTLAAGYIDRNGEISQGVNEIGKVVIDLGEDAILHTPTTLVKGDVGRYVSWEGIENIAKRLGLYEKYGFGSEDKVPLILKKWLENGNADEQVDAHKVFSKIGEYVAVLTYELSRYYEIDNVIISGGLTSGKAGRIIISSANNLLNRYQSNVDIDVSLSSLDEDILKYGSLIGAGYLIRDYIEKGEE